MFRLKARGLPKDPVFPHDLEGLGYFVNSDDEIRNIERPNEYFKYFLTKNDRHNDVQREAMDSAIRTIVKTRIESHGLETLLLPLNTPPTQAHIPIYVSDNIATHSRVIILFYEHTQDLGILAHRITGGNGGINAGSIVDLISYIQAQPSSPTDSESPGLIIANLGQLRWHRRTGRAVSQRTWYALPRKSAAHGADEFDMMKNTVEGNRDPKEHVQYILEEVAGTMLSQEAKVDIIAVSDGALEVVDYFDENEEKFREWKGKLGGLALVAPLHQGPTLKNEEFKKWLTEQARSYTTSSEPANTPIGDGIGTKYHIGYGCNTYSLGEPYYSELLLPKGYKIVVDYLKEVAMNTNFKNEELTIAYPEGGIDENDTWGKRAENWEDEVKGEDAGEGEKESEDQDTGINEKGKGREQSGSATSEQRAESALVHDISEMVKQGVFEAPPSEEDSDGEEMAREDAPKETRKEPVSVVSISDDQR